ncbi:MAG TPA: hypothetical protein VL588_04585, partial [Bdellovibrionota bacterium]|nr:hypothetical protein [Bdellovibrionota bacterium]
MRAPLTQRALAGVVDLGWEISLAWLLLLDPSSAYPGLGRLSVWLLTVAAARTASCAAFSGTFGHLLCGLRLMDSTGERLTGLEAAAAAWGFQRGGFLGRPAGVNSGKIATATASLAALAGVLLNVAAGLTWVRAQPLLLRGIAWQVPVFQAAADPLYQRSWAVLPFFYAVGPWPKRYMGDPVFYTLPYSKGPPKQFPSKVLVRWDSGETRLAIEGPHTPSGGIDEHKLKSCIVDGGYTPACASLKQRVLGDDVARMRSLHASRWTIRWFEVPNTALPENERPHGVYLMGSNGKMVQERYVLITPSGALQALALDHTD